MHNITMDKCNDVTRSNTIGSCSGTVSSMKDLFVSDKIKYVIPIELLFKKHSSLYSYIYVMQFCSVSS